MSTNDLYYRALVAYLSELEEDKDINKFRKIIRSCDIENDKLTTINLICEIDEKWVLNIEEGLPYVEKAVKEERQFIRTEGDVVPIERAKHTSKTTVEHLAKHSNFITHLPEDPADDLVPDKLYIVEKESDYAVYENRFLYMMLLYLRDFIQIRINRIRDILTTYNGKYETTKKIRVAGRDLDIEIKLKDKIKDDPILLEKYNSIKIVDRIEQIYHFVLSLLSTPLMEQVSKSPLIKPPIIKTNTLKMNPNFKAALALYDYISAYNTNGYSFREEEVNLTPLSDENALNYSDVIMLESFLTYRNNNNLNKEYKNHFEEYLNLKKEKDKELRLEQLHRLKRRLNESGETMEEYILILENHNRELEKDQALVPLLKKQIVELKGDIENIKAELALVTKEKEELNLKIKSLEDEILRTKEKAASDLLILEKNHRNEVYSIKARHAEEINSLNQKHELELNDLRNKQRIEIESINNKHKEEISILNNEHKEYVESLIIAKDKEKEEAVIDATTSLIKEKERILIRHEKEVSSLNQDIDNLKVNLDNKSEKLNKALSDKKFLINEYEDKIYNLEKDRKEKEIDLNKQINNKTKEILRLNRNVNRVMDEKRFLDAQVHELRVELNRNTDEYDYSSKERFEELELQYKAFKELFKKEWKNTKLRIKNEVMAMSKDDIESLEKGIKEELIKEKAIIQKEKEEMDELLKMETSFHEVVTDENVNFNRDSESLIKENEELEKEDIELTKKQMEELNINSEDNTNEDIKDEE